MSINHTELQWVELPNMEQVDKVVRTGLLKSDFVAACWTASAALSWLDVCGKCLQRNYDFLREWESIFDLNDDLPTI